MEVDFFKHAKVVDFNSPKIKAEIEKVKQEIKRVLDGQGIDTSKLHIKFN